MLRHLLVAALLLPLAAAHASPTWQGDFAYACAWAKAPTGSSASVACGQSAAYPTTNSTGTFVASFDRTGGTADPVEACVHLYTGLSLTASSCAVTSTGATVSVVASGTETSVVVAIGPPPGAAGPAYVAGPSTWHYKLAHFH